MSILHSLAFDMIQTDRGWCPHYSVAIDGQRICIVGPALPTSNSESEKRWRTHLAEQATKLQDGATHGLVFSHADGGTAFYRCVCLCGEDHTES